jgi:hypothetical protein
MLIKYGDGQIASVIKEEELTEEQRKSTEALSASPSLAKNGEDAKEPKKLENN